jgi:hypothetical protein
MLLVSGCDAFQPFYGIESLLGNLRQGADISAVLRALGCILRDLGVVALRGFEQLMAGCVKRFEIDSQFVVGHAGGPLLVISVTARCAIL